MELQQKLNEIFSNEAFIDAVMEAKTADEFVKVLNENGIVLEEGLSAEDAFNAFKEKQNDELDADDLDNVAGGGLGGAVVLAKGATLITVGAGTAVAAGAVFLVVGGIAAYNAYNKKKRGK